MRDNPSVNRNMNSAPLHLFDKAPNEFWLI